MAQTTAARTAYDQAGADNAETVVLIHGLGLNRATWADLIPDLAENYRVITYDLFGHGESAPPPQTPSLAIFSEQLRDLLDDLGIDHCAVAGFSLGGMINRRMAMDHPDRVSSLIILNSPHERSPSAQKLVEIRAAESAAGGPGATLDTTIERWFTPGFIAKRPNVITTVRDWVMANDPVIYAQCRQVLASGVLELIRPVPAIGKPTLVMTCENDSGSTPEMSLAIASEIAAAQTIIVPNLKHMGLMEQPELFIQPMLNFLAQQYQTESMK